MNADFLIQRAQEAADKLYQDNSTDKLNYQIGFLYGTIRELCIYLEIANAEIKTLQDELRKADD